MNNIISRRVALAAACFASTALAGPALTHAAPAFNVTPVSFCSSAQATGGIAFLINNGQGIEYRLTVVVNGVQTIDDTDNVLSASFEVDTPAVAHGTPIEATLEINGTDYHYGPVVLSDDDACTERSAQHALTPSATYECVDGTTIMDLRVDNIGDYTESFEAVVGTDSLPAQVLAGEHTTLQYHVTAGATVAVALVADTTSFGPSDVLVPTDVCETAETPVSQAGLPETGAGSTLLASLAGLMLAGGATMRRLARRDEVEEVSAESV